MEIALAFAQSVASVARSHDAHCTRQESVTVPSGAVASPPGPTPFAVKSRMGPYVTKTRPSRTAFTRSSSRTASGSAEAAT